MVCNTALKRWGPINLNLELLQLGRFLQEQRYRFTVVTPETHRHVLERQPGRRGETLRDAFGWNLPFPCGLLPDSLLKELIEKNFIHRIDGETAHSRVRFASIEDKMFVHSGFPTDAEDSVFFGPDTYRFVRFLGQALGPPSDQAPRGRLLDIGCGTGAGGLCLGHRFDALVLSDINPAALEWAATNAALCGAKNAQMVHGNLYEPFERSGPRSESDLFDLIVANPPYLVDETRRFYRDGGGSLGLDLGLKIVLEGIDRLNQFGRLLLYTGTPIVAGVDRFWTALEPFIKPWIRRGAIQVSYEEIDPDVFGEELKKPSYRQVDRIAVVGLTIERVRPA